MKLSGNEKQKEYEFVVMLWKFYCEYGEPEKSSDYWDEVVNKISVIRAQVNDNPNKVEIVMAVLHELQRKYEDRKKKEAGHGKI